MEDCQDPSVTKQCPGKCLGEDADSVGSESASPSVNVGGQATININEATGGVLSGLFGGSSSSSSGANPNHIGQPYQGKGHVVFKNAFSSSEMLMIKKSLGEANDKNICQFQTNAFGEASSIYGQVTGNMVCYLHKGDFFQNRHPKLMGKIRRIFRSADGKLNGLWGAAPISRIRMNTIEYARYNAGSWVGWHSDLDGSQYTFVLRLSSDNDFGGGQLQVRVPSYGEVDVDVTQGDVAVFHALTPHRVTPVSSGTRDAFIIEAYLT